MRPKLFARISRSEAALDHKARSAANSWADLAHRFGYHDQMHMIHDFSEFTSETPTRILRQVEDIYVEQIRTTRATSRSGPAVADSRLML